MDRESFADQLDEIAYDAEVAGEASIQAFAKYMAEVIRQGQEKLVMEIIVRETAAAFGRMLSAKK